jgi:uncharacterized protein YjbI with pentapeptide repeats
VLLLTSIVVGVVGYLHQHDYLYLGKILGQILTDYYANVSTELASIAITVLVIDILNERRGDQQLLEQLLLDLGGLDNGMALRALRELKARNWITKETLQRQDFHEADLQRADFSYLSLQGVNLSYANMQYANLAEANLEGADLEGADLEHAHLPWTILRNIKLMRGANFSNAGLTGVVLENSRLGKSEFINTTMHLAQLQNADLSNCNLAGADLKEASLQGADLSGANLKGVKNLTLEQLFQVKSLIHATMPNGKLYDGRFNFKADIEWWDDFWKADPNNPKDMAKVYGISVKQWLAGQTWAKKNLPKLKQKISKMN